MAIRIATKSRLRLQRQPQTPRDQWQERNVCDGSEHSGAGDHRDPPDDPHAGNCCERESRGRGLTSPVANRSEEKSDDHGAGEAEDHLVRVPDDTGYVPERRQHSEELGNPQRQTRRSEQRGKQIEGAKAEIEQRPGKPTGRQTGRRGIHA
jgi:hypothetical protein